MKLKLLLINFEIIFAQNQVSSTAGNNGSASVVGNGKVTSVSTASSSSLNKDQNGTRIIQSGSVTNGNSNTYGGYLSEIFQNSMGQSQGSLQTFGNPAIINSFTNTGSSSSNSPQNSQSTSSLNTGVQAIYVPFANKVFHFRRY